MPSSMRRSGRTMGTTHLVGDILSDHDPIIDEGAENSLVAREDCEVELTLQYIANGERIN